MVKITIIGWYGTETIGDRVILAGIFSLLSKKYGEFSVQIGAIYPFFTQRTIIEDKDFLNLCSDNHCRHLEIFDSQNHSKLNASIDWCDYQIMGGGPLMGMPSLFMVEYAFSRAKRKGKGTMILGCGVGPMIRRIYERSLVSIVAKSDVTILRDDIAKELYLTLAGKKAKPVCAAIDPAVFAARIFKIANADIVKQDEYIVACVRDFPMEYSINADITARQMNQKVLNTLSGIYSQTGKQIKLLPMHYFAIGGDDRVFMNRLSMNGGSGVFRVQNEPLNTEQTMREFAQASSCVGMRFHSVVLQTILNGNNIILDYTDPKKGKIKGFLTQIGALEASDDSFINLQQEAQKELRFVVDYQFNAAAIAEYEKQFIDLMLD